MCPATCPPAIVAADTTQATEAKDRDRQEESGGSGVLDGAGSEGERLILSMARQRFHLQPLSSKGLA